MYVVVPRLNFLVLANEKESFKSFQRHEHLQISKRPNSFPDSPTFAGKVLYWILALGSVFLLMLRKMTRARKSHSGSGVWR